MKNYTLKLDGLNLYLSSKQSLTGVNYTKSIKSAMKFDSTTDNPELKKGIWDSAAKLQHNNSDMVFNVEFL